jgi:hypothetical protein
MAIDFGYGRRRGRRRRRLGWVWLLAALLVAVGALVARPWLEAPPGVGSDNGGGLSAGPGDVALARAAVKELPVAAGAGVPDYERSAFGPAWADVDRNGCDTRNDILRRDLANPVFKPGTHDCVVTAGHLLDPYSGVEIDFVKGNKTSTEVQIDHLVPLAAAWRAGAWDWTDGRRREFANHPPELLAVAGAENQAKGDKGPSDWLPKLGRCGYVVRYLAVLSQWELAIPEDDRRAAQRVLDSDCED